MIGWIGYICRDTGDNCKDGYGTRRIVPISGKKMLCSIPERLIQTCIIHYCFLGIQEFNYLIKLDIIFRFLIFNFYPTRTVHSGLAAHFFNHNQKMILVNIYNYRKRQRLTQLFRLYQKKLYRKHFSS